MPLTISDVLALKPFIAADPKVLTCRNALDRHVRWVHSSEIYEMGPLLSGGELLLTTGLGMAGADAGARRHYIREIAERNVSALGLELGRTFPIVPPELVDEARKRSLPLIVLNRIVPFIKMSEAANTAIIRNNSRRLELVADLSQDLDRALIAGDGIRSLLAIAGQVMGSALVLVAESGVVVSAHGVADERTARQLATAPYAAVALEVRGQPWGRVCAGQALTLDEDDLRTLLDRTAIALTLSLLGTGLPGSDPERQAATLLDDLLAGGTMASTDFTVRAGLAKFHPPPDASMVGVAVEAAQAAPALALIDDAASRLGTPALRGRVRGAVLGVLAVPGSSADPLAAAHGALAAAHQARPVDVSWVVAGPPVEAGSAPTLLAQSLADARDALALTASVPGCGLEQPPVRTTRSLALELHLSRLADNPALDRMITELIGPLISWDQQHRTSLLDTLEVHLRHGCSPTRTAQALYLGRHSVYQRLERIESLLACCVSDPDLHAGLLLATCAVRVRSQHSTASATFRFDTR